MNIKMLIRFVLTDKVNVTKIIFIIKNIIKVLFVKINNEYNESKILFQKINVNKIPFDDFFLKMNVTNIIQLSKYDTISIHLKLITNI